MRKKNSNINLDYTLEPDKIITIIEEEETYEQHSATATVGRYTDDCDRSCAGWL